MNYTNKTRNLIITGVIAAGTVLGIGAVNAAGTTTGPRPIDNLIQAIATRFNLNQADVQKVFDEQRATMITQHEQHFTDRLTQAVTDGKLTQAQAEAIIAKKAELEAQRPDFKDRTPAEIRSEMQTRHQDLIDWAEANNIPQEFRFFDMGFRGKGPGHGPKNNFMKHLNKNFNASSQIK